jgi:hypothetical protein
MRMTVTLELLLVQMFKPRYKRPLKPMYQNTKNRVAYLTALIVTTLCVACEGSVVASSVGADFAESTLDRVQAIAAEYPGISNSQQGHNAVKALRLETSKKLSQMTEEDRVDYVEYMATKVAGYGSDDKKDNETGEAALVFISCVTSLEDLAAGSSRLLSSDDPSVRATGEKLLKIDEVKLANGEMAHDISFYDRALHDPKTPQDRLIGVLFKLAPVESAQWFADHTGLPANERAALESDLQKAWQIHRALNYPSVDRQSKAILDSSVKNPLLDRWLRSPSWILRSLANGLLQQHSEWQTPDLKKGMQPVQVPVGLQISNDATK